MMFLGSPYQVVEVILLTTEALIFAQMLAMPIQDIDGKYTITFFFFFLFVLKPYSKANT